MRPAAQLSLTHADFWITVVALCVAPFVFNPHQFSFSDFIVDYRELLRWFARGNARSHANSWTGYVRLSRTRITGFKKKRLGHPSEKLATDVPRAGWTTVLVSEILSPVALAVLVTICYLFVKSFADPQINALLRIAVIALGPIVANMAILVVLFFVSILAGPLLSRCSPKFGSWMAAIAHGAALLSLCAFFELLFYLEGYSAGHAVLGVIAVTFIQRAIFKIIVATLLTREFKHDSANQAWWLGTWHNVRRPARLDLTHTARLRLSCGHAAVARVCHQDRRDVPLRGRLPARASADLIVT